MIISFIKKAANIADTRLYKAIKHFIDTVASNRCKKYFVGGCAATQRVTNNGETTDSQRSEFEKRLEDVVRTLFALRATFTSAISVNGESYLTSEYKIPRKLESYLDSGRIYMTGDAVGRREALEAEKVQEGTILTPIQFNAFWDEFNRNQDEGNRIVLNDGYVRKTFTLGNLQFSDDGDGLLVKINDVGLCAEECWLIEVQLKDDEGYTKYPSVTEDGFTLFFKN